MVRLNGAFGAGSQLASRVLSGILVLEIEVKRAIGIVLEGHPTADRESVQDIADLESVLIVKGDRPEGIDRRRSALLKSDGVLVCAIERLAGFVAEIKRVDGILDHIRAKSLLRENSPLQVIIAIYAHCVGVHRPAVRHPSQRRQFPSHQLLPVFGCAL
jgi:hypothetical protein